MYYLEFLFQTVQDFSKNLIEKHPDFDGKKLWDSLKEELTDIDEKASDWSLSEGWKRFILSLLTKVDDILDKPPNESDSHHFLRQHVRLTSKPPTVTTIIQLAFNIGMWKGKPDAELMKILKYDDSNLDKLSSYIYPKDIMKLSNKIPDEIVNLFVIRIFHYSEECL